LLKSELKEGQRYIWGKNGVHVLTTFAPRANNEIEFLFEGISNLTQLSEDQTQLFATALTKTFKVIDLFTIRAIAMNYTSIVDVIIHFIYFLFRRTNQLELDPLIWCLIQVH
jgi:hypothetical protein